MGEAAFHSAGAGGEGQAQELQEQRRGLRSTRHAPHASELSGVSDVASILQQRGPVGTKPLFQCQGRAAAGDGLPTALL